MHEGDLRVSLKGTQARKRERERGGEKELLAEASVGCSEARLEGAIVCKEQRAIVDKGIDAPRV